DCALFILRQQRVYVSQNLDAAHAANRFVGVWEVLADVARANRAQQRICDRVGQDVRVRMSFKPARVRDLHAAENQFSSCRKTMHVVADSAPNHRGQSFKSMTPLEATMLYFSFMSSRGRRSTVPPAVSIKSQPAAMSQRLIPCSMYASRRPQAT